MSWALTFQICMQISTLKSASSILATSNTSGPWPARFSPVDTRKKLPQGALERRWRRRKQEIIYRPWTQFYQHWRLFHNEKEQIIATEGFFFCGQHTSALVPTGIDKRSIKHLNGCCPVGPILFQVLTPVWQSGINEWNNPEKLHLDKSSKRWASLSLDRDFVMTFLSLIRLSVL